MPSTAPGKRPDISTYIASVQHLADSANLDELVVVSLRVGELAGQSTFTFERMVELAFRCFPTRFALKGYPEWPDSVVVNKCWLRARTDRRWLVGSVREGFSLTGPGREIAERLMNSTSAPRRQRATDSRTREGRLLAALKATTGYQRFTRGDTLSLDDFADGLLATGDAPRSTLLSNIAEFRAAAELYDDSSVTEFLRAAEAHLGTGPGQTGHTGGMMRRRGG